MDKKFLFIDVRALDVGFVIDVRTTTTEDKRIACASLMDVRQHLNAYLAAAFAPTPEVPAP